eukprot:scaffold234848_cov43-Prasinocladus_malaysianus.AAC.1
MLSVQQGRGCALCGVLQNGTTAKQISGRLGTKRHTLHQMTNRCADGTNQRTDETVILANKIFNNDECNEHKLLPIEQPQKCTQRQTIRKMKISANDRNGEGYLSCLEKMLLMREQRHCVIMPLLLLTMMEQSITAMTTAML